jgi:hypothetical protein
VFNIDIGVAPIAPTTRGEPDDQRQCDGELYTNQNLAALNIGSVGSVSVTAASPPNYKLLYVNMLTIAFGGKFDITNNEVVIDFASNPAAESGQTNDEPF